MDTEANGRDAVSSVASTVPVCHCRGAGVLGPDVTAQMVRKGLRHVTTFHCEYET